MKNVPWAGSRQHPTSLWRDVAFRDDVENRLQFLIFNFAITVLNQCFLKLIYLWCRANEVTKLLVQLFNNHWIKIATQRKYWEGSSAFQRWTTYHSARYLPSKAKKILCVEFFLPLHIVIATTLIDMNGLSFVVILLPLFHFRLENFCRFFFASSSHVKLRRNHAISLVSRQQCLWFIIWTKLHFNCSQP